MLEARRKVIITDCRFNNEIKMVNRLLEKYNGLSIEVTGRSGIQSSHVSESIPLCVEKLDNSGTLDELKDQIQSLVTQYDL